MSKHLLTILIISSWFSCTAQESSDTFTPEEIALIYQADTSEAMRVLKITNQEDSIFLRQASQAIKITPGDTALAHFVQRLFKTVRHPKSLGVGIAAPQVGIHRQIIWVQRFDKEAENFPFEVYLNPQIIEYSDSTKITPEGCLSIPDRSEKVERPCTIVIAYDQMDGSHHQETISGYTSVIFQHEIDHLRGILYLDHLKQEE